MAAGTGLGRHMPPHPLPRSPAMKDDPIPECRPQVTHQYEKCGLGATPMASITIQATDGAGSFSAYLVEPKSKPAGVVVLIQEIFGVNQAMRDIAAWVADMDFIALCPDLFWRIQPNIDITDKTDAEWKQAFELFQKFDQAKGIEDLKATVAAARNLPGANGKVGTMGYCLGGRLAFMMAEQSDADVN